MSRQELQQAAMEYCGEDTRLQSAFMFGADYAWEHPQWMSVKEKLPVIGEVVQIYVEDLDDVVYAALRLTGDWWCEEYGCHFTNITYWMHKPKAPGKEE